MSQYFNKFPKTFYNNILTTSILERIGIVEDYKNNDNLYYFYDYQEGDTPEIIASKYYENAELHWLVLLSNDIFDNKFDLPMRYDTFNRYIEDKYSEIAKTSPKELYINDSGLSDGYVDGTYIDVPLQILEFQPLSSYGSGLTVDITVYNGEIISVKVRNAGSNYTEDTFLTIASPAYLLSNAEFPTCIFSPISFMNGNEYASYAVDPKYGYQKVIRTSELFNTQRKSSLSVDGKTIYPDPEIDISKDKKVIAEEFYPIGEQSYYNLIINSKGYWKENNDYLINDVVVLQSTGTKFICNISHESSNDFLNDLEYKKWSIYEGSQISTTFYEKIYSEVPQQNAIRLENGEQTILYEIIRRFPLVTILDRELEINESKRRIKLLKKEYIPIAVNQFNYIMGKSNA